MRTVLALCCLLSLASAKIPPLHEVLAGDLIAKAKIRWVRLEKGAPTTVDINRGEAFRTNTDMGPDPLKLPYDLKKHAALEAAVKGGKLPGPTKASAKPGDRTLQIMAEGDKDWEVAGEWTYSKSVWKKRWPKIYGALEPLCDVMADVFQPMKEKKE
jgi:hypothetical protein